MGFPALPFIPVTRESVGVSSVLGAELDMRDDVGEEEDASPEERGGLILLPVGSEEPLCCLWAHRGQSEVSPCFPLCPFFLCPLEKDTDVAVVLETVETTISIV